MEYKENVGVIIGRFQTPYLHKYHKFTIKSAIDNCAQVIVFLGVSPVKKTEKNPLDYKTREMMIKELFPNVTILPLPDMRCDNDWSINIDNKIKEVTSLTPILIGSRDSFIPHYKGKHKTHKLHSDDESISASSIRLDLSSKIIKTIEGRSGIIQGVYGNYPKVFPTVDVVAYTDNLEILLGRKPGENKFRFVGGYVDVNDSSLEEAAKREFKEETNSEIGDLIYISSRKIDDWRYRNLNDKIHTTLFIGKLISHDYEASDDIEECKLFKITSIMEYPDEVIMEEHLPLFKDLMSYYKRRNLI